MQVGPQVSRRGPKQEPDMCKFVNGIDFGPYNVTYSRLYTMESGAIRRNDFNIDSSSKQRCLELRSWHHSAGWTLRRLLRTTMYA